MQKHNCWSESWFYVVKDWLLGSTTIVIDSSAKQTTKKQLDADQERKEAESMIENEEKEDICQDELLEMICNYN